MIEEPLASGKSFIHRLHPQPKLISAGLLSLLVALAGNLATLCAALAVAFMLVLWARLPVRILLKRLAAVSGFLKRETIEVFGTGRDIEVIPNFVDARVFRPREMPQLRKRFAPAGEKLLLHASNFRKVKNVEAVVKVFAEVCKKTPCRLLLVGDGPEMSVVREQVAAADLGGAVEFLGQVDNLEDVLPVADMLLLPSLHESFGLVALEAMACGVIPLATNRGGAGEFIQDGQNGFLRDPHDIRGMAEAVLGVLGDDALRQEMAEEGRREAAAEFGASCVVKRYLDLYDRLLGGDG